VATGFGISSTTQAYWIEDAASQTEPSWLFLRLLVLNLIYWYVPALLAPVIMRLSLDWRPDRRGWPTVALFHLGVLFLYSCAHTAVLIGCRMVVIPLERVRAAENWWRYTRHAYLHQLDWLLMTYLFLVGLAYAL